MRFAFEGLLEGIAMRPPVGRDPLPTAVLGFADEPPVPACLVTLFFMLCSKKKPLGGSGYLKCLEIVWCHEHRLKTFFFRKSRSKQFNQR